MYLLARTSWADAKIGTDFLGVEVLVDNALDDAGAVVVQEARAGLTEARYELVQSLGMEIKSSVEAGWDSVIFTVQIWLKKSMISCSVVSDVMNSS